MAKSKTPQAELPVDSTGDNTEHLPVHSKASEFLPLAMPAEEFRELVRANVGDGGLSLFDLPRIRVPSGGGLSWTVPSGTGRPEVTPVISGVVLYWKDVRAYWDTPFGGGAAKSPPVCRSDDSLVGIGKPGGSCRACPMAQFGSKILPGGAAAKGQACSMKRLMLVLRAGRFFPDIIFAPPTSLQPLRQYMLGLVNEQLHYQAVVTNLALSPDRNAGGIEYAKIQPSIERKLSAEEIVGVKQMATALVSGISQLMAEITPDDYGGGGENDAGRVNDPADAAVG